MWHRFWEVSLLLTGGKAELRKYGKDPVMKVEQRHRLSSSFSDFITRYTAVSSTNKQTQIAEYYALDRIMG